jgi:CRP-like cAMP-binding protein
MPAKLPTNRNPGANLPHTENHLLELRPASDARNPGANAPHTENHLLELLPALDAQRLREAGSLVDLKLSAALCEPGDVTAFAYFPVNAFISMVAHLEEHPGLEVGMIGREGMLGLQLSLGVPIAPLRALVQGTGSTWRIEAAAFRAELARSKPLRTLLHRYTYCRMAQLASAAACLRFHLIGPRLARWLLMSQDRAHANHFRLTHDFLAYMLGVRRVGITVAAGSLQRAGLIGYHRGEITVLNRPGLEKAACACYAIDCQSYSEIMG